MLNNKTHAMTLWRTEHSLLTIEDLARAAGMTPELVDTFVRYRLVEPSARVSSYQLFSMSSIERLKSISRLRYEVGVNLAGVGLILDMAERIEELSTELRTLRRFCRLEKQILK
jgi:DNA-binding transcriptional MerR regulator